MKFGLTGATGTVGSAILARLSGAGATVRCLVRRPEAAPRTGDAVIGSLDDLFALEELARGAEVLVHCAVTLSDDPVENRRVNTEGARNVAAAALVAGATLVHVSTVSVYDHSRSSSLTEDSPLVVGPPDNYGRSKAEAERLIHELGQRGLRFVFLRPVVVLSMHPRSYWGPLAVARARQEPGPVFPESELPYVHADNVAEAVLLAATTRAALGRAYNVIDGYGPTRDYLKAIAAATRTQAPSLPPDAPTVRYSGERIRTELGYSPVDRWSEFIAQLAAPPR